MSVQVVFRDKRALTSGWMAGKGMRAAVLLGSLLTLSIAVNTMVIFAARGRL